MLDGADLHVVFADGRCVLEGRGRRLQRRNAQAVQIGADEGDPVAGDGRVQLDGGVDPGVQPDAGDADGPC
jgi:hypothetical protein